MVPAYLPADQALYTPVLDDRTGRTDQVSFGVRGIPSLGDIGQYDSSIDPLVGGADNPYPDPNYAAGQADPVRRVRPGLQQRLLLEPELLGLRHRARPGRYDQPSEGLLRASSSSRRGSPTSSPRRRRAARSRSRTARSPTSRCAEEADGPDHRLFDAGFSRKKDGKTDGPEVLLGLRRRHPAGVDDGPDDPAHLPDAGGVARRQAARPGRRQVGVLPSGGADRLLPDVLPAVAPASEPLPPATGPPADPCGKLSPAEEAALIAAGEESEAAEEEASVAGRDRQHGADGQHAGEGEPDAEGRRAEPAVGAAAEARQGGGAARRPLSCRTPSVCSSSSEDRCPPVEKALSDAEQRERKSERTPPSSV